MSKRKDIATLEYNPETEQLISSETLFELTSVDTGKTFVWSKAKCEEYFGVEEFDEIRQGYLPHIVCIEL